MEWILDYVFGSAEVARAGSYMQTGQRAANDLLSCVDHSLQCSPICCQAPRVPHCDAVRQDALHGGSVEHHQQPLLQVVLPEDSQEVELLLGLLYHRRGVDSPREVVEICTPRNLKEWTLSTHSPLIVSGARSALPFLKSMIISFVFVVFSKIVC